MIIYLSIRLGQRENSISILAECGDFNPEVHNADFVSEFRFSPSQTEVMEMDILRNFMTLMYVGRMISHRRGMS